jgi:signal transduction histidine kinase/HAMP domain-containing protein
LFGQDVVGSTESRETMLKILERSIALQLLVFYVLFIVPLLLGGVELFLFQRDALQQSAQRTNLGIAQAIALEIRSTIRSAVEETVELSTSTAASQLDLPQLKTLFTSANRSHPGIGLYFVCDQSGRLLLSYPIDGGRGSPCEYTPPVGALQSGTPVISPGRVSPTTQADVVSIATQISDARGRPIGLVGINLPLVQLTAHLQEVQEKLTANGEVHIWIVDERGRLLASTGNTPFQADLRATLPGLVQALQGEQGNLIAQRNNRDWLYSYLPVAGTQWAVMIQRPTDVTFATIISFQNSLLIALITLLIGASFFWLALHGWVVAPLAKLAQAVRLIRPDREGKVTQGALLTKDRDRSDEIGQLITAFSTMEDEIHALFRKSNERSQARLHTLDAIMRSMDEGVLLEQPDGRIIYANQSFTQFVGLPPQEFLLEDSFDEHTVEEQLLTLIEEPETYHQAILRAENEGGPQTIAFQTRGYYNQVGQLIPVQRDIRLRLFQVRDQAGHLIGRGKIFRDVTRQNEAEQIKKNLLAIVSHELRTPLTAIKGYATSLLETDVELDEELQEHCLRRIVEEGDRMADLVTSLLEMSQVEAGTLKLTPSLCRLDRLVEQVVEAERAHIRVKIPEQVPLLYLDQRRIEVVLRNLIENARRYAGAGADIEIFAGYEQRPADRGLYLSITDNGPGLPPHLTERIFDRFYQVDGGRERSSSGVGLGLAICRGFIEAHGGRIWAENRSDGVTGAIFHIWLPPKVLHPPVPQSNRFELYNAL